MRLAEKTKGVNRDKKEKRSEARVLGVFPSIKRALLCSQVREMYIMSWKPTQVF